MSTSSTPVPAAPAPLLFDRATFFGLVRKPLFSAKLTAEQVGGLEDMLAEWEARYRSEDVRHLAYIFATVHHETGRRMVPIEEKGGAAYFTGMYDIKGERPKVARALGNRKPGDGALFHGRGRVQATGRDNYAKLAARLGRPLVEHPELMLDPVVDAAATFAAMTDGIYTGRKLSDYFGPAKDDPKGARRIINGTDKADEIAGYDALYLRALVAAHAAAAEPVTRLPKAP